MRATRPASLSPQARVAVTCPASPVATDQLRRGIAHLRDLGMEVVVGRSCETGAALWAGDDQLRADELAGFLLDHSIEAVFAMVVVFPPCTMRVR